MDNSSEEIVPGLSRISSLRRGAEDGRLEVTVPGGPHEPRKKNVLAGRKAPVPKERNTMEEVGQRCANLDLAASARFEEHGRKQASLRSKDFWTSFIMSVVVVVGALLAVGASTSGSVVLSWIALAYTIIASIATFFTDRLSHAGHEREHAAAAAAWNDIRIDLIGLMDINHPETQLRTIELLEGKAYRIMSTDADMRLNNEAVAEIEARIVDRFKR